MIKLVSSDGFSYVIEKNVALQSGTINAMLSGGHGSSEVKFDEISGFTLEKILQCLEIISIENRFKKLSKFINTQDLSHKALEDFLLAANFLDIQPIIDAVVEMYVDLGRAVLCCDKHVQQIFAKSEDDLIEELRILARNLTNIIGYCRQLTSLNFAYNKITDVELYVLAPHLQALTSLSFRYCPHITDKGLEVVVPHLKALTSLSLSSANITDAGFQALAPHLQALTSLYLFDCANITDTGLQAAAPHLQVLTDLAMGGSNITDAGLQAAVPHLQALTSLYLAGSNITDAGLQALARHLQALTSLEMLSVNITDVGLQALGHLQALTSLRFDSPKVTDAALQALVPRLKALSKLSVFCYPQLSRAVLKELQDLIKNRSRSLVELCSDCIGAQALQQ